MTERKGETDEELLKRCTPEKIHHLHEIGCLMEHDPEGFKMLYAYAKELSDADQRKTHTSEVI